MFPSFNPPQPVKAVTPYPPPGSKVWATFEHISTGNDAVYGVAVDSSGNVYVADTNNNRVQLFGDAVLRFWVA